MFIIIQLIPYIFTLTFKAYLNFQRYHFQWPNLWLIPQYKQLQESQTTIKCDNNLIKKRPNIAEEMFPF